MNEALIKYLLSLGDTSLILGQRLGEWCGHGPVLEQDIAMTNISLDYIGRARLFYQYVCELQNDGQNEDQIASFLSRHPDYKILPLKQAWEGDPDRIPNDGDFLRLYPAAHGTDGFFAAILQKQ